MCAAAAIVSTLKVIRRTAEAVGKTVMPIGSRVEADNVSAATVGPIAAVMAACPRGVLAAKPTTAGAVRHVVPAVAALRVLRVGPMASVVSCPDLPSADKGNGACRLGGAYG